MTEDEWRSGKKADGTPIVQDGAAPTTSAAAKRAWSTPTITTIPADVVRTFDAKATGAFIEGVHVDSERTDSDVITLATKITKVQAEVAALGAEALRVRDDALQQLDALKKRDTLLEKECRNELTKFGWPKLALEDYVHNLIHDNVRMHQELVRERSNLKTTVDEHRAALATIANLEDELRVLRRK